MREIKPFDDAPSMTLPVRTRPHIKDRGAPWVDPRWRRSPTVHIGERGGATFGDGAPASEPRGFVLRDVEAAEGGAKAVLAANNVLPFTELEQDDWMPLRWADGAWRSADGRLVSARFAYVGLIGWWTPANRLPGDLWVYTPGSIFKEDEGQEATGAAAGSAVTGASGAASTSTGAASSGTTAAVDLDKPAPAPGGKPQGHRGRARTLRDD
jgi:hypothetical protein